MTNASELWIPRRRLPDAKAILMFPAAGGTAAAFSDWRPLAAPAFEVLPLKLPGRGVRLKETPIASVGELITSIANVLGPILPTGYCVFGQCLGGVLAYEFTREIAKRFAPPAHLFVSGCGDPRSETKQQLSNLDDASLVEQLRSWGGTPELALARRDFLDLLLPPLRIDLQMFERYAFDPVPTIATPVTVFRGADDHHVTPESLAGWRERTTGAVTIVELAGGHFIDPALLMTEIRRA